MFLVIKRAASHDGVVTFDSFAKRQEDLAIYRRQSNLCVNQCARLVQAVPCTTASCVCPIYNRATSADIRSCTNCLISAGSTYLASNITLISEICNHCQTPCDGTLTEYLQANNFCVTDSCTCSYLEQLEPSSITNCANCMKAFDKGNATAVYIFAEQCGIFSAAAASSFIASVRSSATRFDANGWWRIIFGSVSSIVCLFVWP